MPRPLTLEALQHQTQSIFPGHKFTMYFFDTEVSRVHLASKYLRTIISHCENSIYQLSLYCSSKRDSNHCALKVTLTR